MYRMVKIKRMIISNVVMIHSKWAGRAGGQVGRRSVGWSVGGRTGTQERPTRRLLLRPRSAMIYLIYLSLAFSWLANANLAAFSCSLANLFSYLDTFLSVGLMNLPFMSL